MHLFSQETFFLKFYAHRTLMNSHEELHRNKFQHDRKERGKNKVLSTYQTLKKHLLNLTARWQRTSHYYLHFSYKSSQRDQKTDTRLGKMSSFCLLQMIIHWMSYLRLYHLQFQVTSCWYQNYQHLSVQIQDNKLLQYMCIHFCISMNLCFLKRGTSQLTIFSKGRRVTHFFLEKSDLLFIP